MKALFKITILLALVLPILMNQTQANELNLDKEFTNSERSNWNTENIKVSSHGKIEFNDDYTDIIHISNDGYLKISMVSFGMRRNLYFCSYNGKVDRLYYEGHKQVNFEPKGHKWMKEILPKVVRNSGLDLKRRVNKAYRKGGINTFLSELEETDSDYFKSQMVHLLLENNELKKKEKEKLLKKFPTLINSKYELSQIYKRHNSVFIDDDILSKEFFNSLNQVSSDYELAQILNSVFVNNTLNDSSFEFFISAMGNIHSDYEKSNLIKLAISKGKTSEIKLNLILNNLKDIDSDYEKGIIINTIINENLFEAGNIDKIIELSSEVYSDNESTLIMKKMLKHGMITLENKEQFKQMMNNLSSSYSYQEVLKAFLKYDELNKNNFVFMMEASDKITSSYELGLFYKMILNKEGLSTKQQLILIDKASNINSDYEYASFLIEATQQLDLDNEKIQNALIDATQKIDSEYDYGKIMKAIYSHKRN